MVNRKIRFSIAIYSTNIFISNNSLKISSGEGFLEHCIQQCHDIVHHDVCCKIQCNCHHLIRSIRLWLRIFVIEFIFRHLKYSKDMMRDTKMKSYEWLSRSILIR